MAAAVALMGWGARSHAWWSRGGGDMHFEVGLRATLWICTAGHCRGRSLAAMGHTWARAGRATFDVGLPAAAFLAVAAVMIAVGNGGRPARLACYVGAAGALVSVSLAAAFVAIHPISLGNLTASYAAVAFLAGGVLGTLGGLVGARSL